MSWSQVYSRFFSPSSYYQQSVIYPTFPFDLLMSGADGADGVSAMPWRQLSTSGVPGQTQTHNQLTAFIYKRSRQEKIANHRADSRGLAKHG